MRQFNLKGEWLAGHPHNRCADPGRTIHPEPMRLAEPWRPANHAPGEQLVSRESDVDEEQHRAAREWLWRLENGRIGGHLPPLPAGEGWGEGESDPEDSPQ